jgi:hypothetical protein
VLRRVVLRRVVLRRVVLVAVSREGTRSSGQGLSLTVH